MNRSRRFLFAAGFGLLAAGFVMGAAVPRSAAPGAAESCPFLGATGVECPALEGAASDAALWLRSAGAACPAYAAPSTPGCPGLPAAGSCPATPTDRCPALDGAGGTFTISPAVWIVDSGDGPLSLPVSLAAPAPAGPGEPLVLSL